MPFYGLIDLDVADLFRKLKTNRNGQPLPALGRFDPVAVLPVILLILNAVEIAEYIRPANFIKIAQPGKILRLMNCNDQNKSLIFII